MRVSRRTFLKGVGAGGASVAALRLLGGPGTTLVAAGEGSRAPLFDTVPSTCWIGKQECGMVAHRVDGRVIKFEGDPGSPRNLGTLCPKGVSQIMPLYDPNRVKAPLVRAHPKGESGTWRAASWDEAMGITAAALKGVLDRDPSLLLWQKGRSKSKYLYDEDVPDTPATSKFGHGAYCSD